MAAICNSCTTTVTVTATGGTGRINGTGTYTVGPGAYYYTVTDAAGCTATTTLAILVSVPDLSIAGTGITNISCRNGSNGTINANVTGGTAPYTYQWSNGASTPGISGLVAGTYSLTVTDARGSVVRGTYQLTQPATSLVHSGTVTNVTCYAAITVIASGGVPPYIYSWSNGAVTSVLSGLTTGIYSLTVTDANGCSNSNSYAVTTGAVAIAVTPSNNTYTGGINTNIYLGYGPKSAKITATDTPGTVISYLWSPATYLNNITSHDPTFTPTVEGNYTYTVTTVTASGCVHAATVSFCVRNIIVPGTSGKKVYICHNGSMIQTSNTGTAIKDSINNGWLLGACNNQCGMPFASKDMNHSDPTAVEDAIASVQQVKVFPNPAGNIFNVVIPAEYKEAEVVIFDLTGRVVERRILTDNVGVAAQFNSNDYAPGLYIVRVSSGEMIFIDKLLKK